MRTAERRRRDELEDYIAHRWTRGDWSDATVPVVRTVLLGWHRTTGWAPASRWTAEQAAAWVTAPARPNTSRSRRGKLAPYLRWHDRPELADLPRVRVPSPAPRDITPDEVARLLQVVPDERGRVIVLLMVHCGLRCGDLARVRIEDMDMARRQIHVRGKGGRGEPTHWVPVPGEAWRAVLGLLAVEGLRSGPLVRARGSRSTGGRLQAATIGRMVRGWMVDAGVKVAAGDGVSAHSLRHSCAQHLVDDGADLRLVQHALGHSSLRTTEWYVRREPPGLRDVMEGRAYLDAA